MFHFKMLQNFLLLKQLACIWFGKEHMVLLKVANKSGWFHERETTEPTSMKLGKLSGKIVAQWSLFVSITHYFLKNMRGLDLSRISLSLSINQGTFTTNTHLFFFWLFGHWVLSYGQLGLWTWDMCFKTPNPKFLNFFWIQNVFKFFWKLFINFSKPIDI